MYIAMNRFKIVLGKEKEFEDVWKNRDTHLDGVKSDAFRLAHKNAAQHRDLYLGPPDFEGFEVIL